MTSTTKLPPEANLLELITGHWRSCAVHAAAKLGVADIFAMGRSAPRRSPAGSACTSAPPSASCARSPASASSPSAAAASSWTPMADLLRSDRPDPCARFSLAIGGAPLRAWGELDGSVRSGQPAFDQVHGESFFAYLAEHEDAARAFDEAMIEQSSLVARRPRLRARLPSFRTIVDVGGGAARSSSASSASTPARAASSSISRRWSPWRAPCLAGGDLADRLDFAGGNFFEAVPAGGDAYILAMVIHDWSDADAVRILRTVRDATALGAKILLSELLIPPGNTPFFGKLLDLDMLVNLGGRERTADEYRALRRSGPSLSRFVPAHGPMSVLSIIEGSRA